MVKEVEIANIELKGDYNLDLLDGNLIDEGNKLILHNIQSQAILCANPANALFVAWANIDFNQKDVAFYELFYEQSTEEFDTEIEIDLSALLTTPRSLPTNIVTKTIDIHIFTYEANIVTEYGSKRLSVPYKIITPSNLVTPKSTDGILILGHVGCEIDADPEEIKQNIILGYLNNAGIISNILISRYIKTELLTKTLLETSFKGYNDKEAIELANDISICRHAAKSFIKVNDIINAEYSLIKANSIYNSANTNRRDIIFTQLNYKL